MTLHDKIAAQTARYWSKVQKTETCWLWTGAKQRHGYGSAWWLGRKVSAHRLSWFLAHNEWPGADTDVCHSCDTPGCVNPAHLWLGDAKANAADAIKKGRYKATGAKTPWTRAVTHCKKGHPLSGDNLVPWLIGKQRLCKTCNREYQLAYQRNRRAANRGLPN